MSARLPLDPSGRPILVPEGTADIVREIRDRAPRYVPEWLGAGRPDDAGEAFTLLYSGMARTVATRVNQLPDKAYREYLRAGGVSQGLGSPATTTLQFTASRASRTPPFIGRGFKVGGTPAEGDAERVVFETARDLYVSGGVLERVVVRDGPFARDVVANDPMGEPFTVFPEQPEPTQALWLGISADRHPGTRLSLAVEVASATGTPPPQAAGGLETSAGRPLPTLEWAVGDGGRIRAGNALYDTTRALTQSGAIELSLPESWAPSTLPISGGPPLYWLRLRVQRGEYPAPVRLRSLLLDAVAATASATLRGEILTQIDARTWQLAQRPVVPQSLVLTVRDTAAELAGDPSTPWTEVASLGGQAPTAQVYTLDAQDGRVQFGDGIDGAAPPIGFRHVRATRYRVSFGASSRVAADGLDQLLDAAPLVLSVRNPTAASGGRNPEPLDDTLRRGPAQLRARGRAVAAADFAELARTAPGADVRRAFAVPGLHPSYPGAPQPGVVGVLVVGEPAEVGPPIPTAPTLAAVARHLADVGPVGVTVVAGPAAFAEVVADLRVSALPDAALSDVLRDVLAALDRYLDPFVGGDAGTGFAFGAPLRHARLLRHLLAAPGVAAIPLLNLTVDGVRQPACSDVALPPWSLPWPGSHSASGVGGDR